MQHELQMGSAMQVWRSKESCNPRLHRGLGSSSRDQKESKISCGGHSTYKDLAVKRQRSMHRTIVFVASPEFCASHLDHTIHLGRRPHCFFGHEKCELELAATSFTVKPLKTA